MILIFHSSIFILRISRTMDVCKKKYVVPLKKNDYSYKYFKFLYKISHF